MPKIFLSYRRQDSAGLAGRIYDRLSDHFGGDAVFMDLASIPLGVDFRDHITSALDQCGVLLAVIGRNWSGEGDASRRIDDPQDIVRIEIESALERNLPVIPILIDRAPMPGEADLPPSMARLANHNALNLDQGRDFHHHVDQLIEGVEYLFHQTYRTVAVPPRPSEKSSAATPPQADRKPSREPGPIDAGRRPGAGAMAPTKLGCPHPRYAPNVEPTFEPVAGRICKCGNCGRLVVACARKGCKGLGTFNHPFVRRCRRCGEEIDQAADWERARSEGWNLIPRSVGPREVIADLSSLADTSLPAPASLAMIRGDLAIHQAGHYLALLKVTPGTSGSPFLWKEDEYPFPALPDGTHPAPYPPVLLPDSRHLMYSCPQGVLLLDLWSCCGLSAKDDNPRYRLIECRHRSLAAAPMPLDECHVGLLTRDRTSDKDFRWAVWDLSRPQETDAEFKARLDSVGEAAGRLPHPIPLGLEGRTCRADLVGERIVAFTTAREQKVWRKEDALALAVEKMVRTWPSPKTDPGESIILNQEDWASVWPPRHAFLLPTRGVRQKFSWFLCVREDDAANRERVEHYEVDFDTLFPTFPQPIGLPSGAVPIGSAPDQDGNLRQMYFRVGTEVWLWADGLSASRYQGGLPRALVSLQLSGPLVVSVEHRDQGQRSIRIDSLHHRTVHVTVLVEDKLLSEPLLWHHWLFTIELDVEGHLQAYRRTVTFMKPETKA